MHSILLQLKSLKIDQIANYVDFKYGKWGLVWDFNADEREDGKAVPEHLFDTLSPKHLFWHFKQNIGSKVNENILDLKAMPSLIEHISFNSE